MYKKVVLSGHITWRLCYKFTTCGHSHDLFFIVELPSKRPKSFFLAHLKTVDDGGGAVDRRQLPVLVDEDAADDDGAQNGPQQAAPLATASKKRPQIVSKSSQKPRPVSV